MTIFCSVGCCARLALWRFGDLGLCQRHWRDWCRSTWQALLANVEQPVMEDWVATVVVWETATAGPEMNSEDSVRRF